jgi:hypothetical protein
MRTVLSLGSGIRFTSAFLYPIVSSTGLSPHITRYIQLAIDP